MQLPPQIDDRADLLHTAGKTVQDPLAAGCRAPATACVMAVKEPAVQPEAPPTSDLERSACRPSSDEFRNQLVHVLPKLRCFAASYCKFPADADDAVQTTCERALAHWQQWSGQGKIEHWLISILINVRRDEERTPARKLLCPLERPVEHEACSNAAQCVYLEEVRREVMLLPRHLREALWLFACRGLSYRETARALGVPVGTVMSRLSRARNALRARLE